MAKKGKAENFYKIVSHYSIDTVQNEVNELLNDGYKLVGGLFVILLAHGDPQYSQALHKIDHWSAPYP